MDEHGPDKRRCFPRAGFRNANDIPARERHGQRLFLDRRRLGVARLDDGRHEIVVKAEMRKRHTRRGHLVAGHVEAERVADGGGLVGGEGAHVGMFAVKVLGNVGVRDAAVIHTGQGLNLLLVSVVRVRIVAGINGGGGGVYFFIRIYILHYKIYKPQVDLCCCWFVVHQGLLHFFGDEWIGRISQ